MQTDIQIEQNPQSMRTHIIAGWPLILILFGGAIGLVFAVIAYVINLQVLKSVALSQYQKIGANLLCGMSAISLWWFVATWVQSQI